LSIYFGAASSASREINTVVVDLLNLWFLLSIEHMASIESPNRECGAAGGLNPGQPQPLQQEVRVIFGMHVCLPPLSLVSACTTVRGFWYKSFSDRKKLLVHHVHPI
jgi:hypothetical protein